MNATLTYRERPMSIHITALALFGLLALALPAAAEKADREKPIRYSANSLIIASLKEGYPCPRNDT